MTAGWWTTVGSCYGSKSGRLLPEMVSWTAGQAAITATGSATRSPPAGGGPMASRSRAIASYGSGWLVGRGHVAQVMRLTTLSHMEYIGTLEMECAMPDRKNAQKTERLTCRITPETAAQLASLARLWGGVVRPLTTAATVDEAIRRCYEAVMGPAEVERPAADAEPAVFEGESQRRPKPRPRPHKSRQK